MKTFRRVLPLVLAILLTASASSIFINSSSDLKYYSDENLSVRITNESEIVLPSDGDPAGNQDLTINLSQVLTAGNRPGNNDIDLDGQSLRRVDELNPIGVTNLNISSNTSFQNSTVVNVSIGGPPSVVDKEYVDRADVFVGDNQTLDEVLDIGNSAGNNDIFLNDNNLMDTGNLTTNTSLRLGEPGRIYLPSGGPVTGSDTVLGNLSQVLRGGNEAGEFDILLNDNDLEEVNALNPGESQNITVGVGLELRNNTIRNLSEPTQPGQAATKQYVDTTEDTIIQDDQDLKDVLGQGRSAGSFDINLTGQELIDTSGPLTLRGETEVAGGNLSLNGNNINQVSRINGQLVQNLGTSSLTEVLNEGNKASTNINLNGFNLTDNNEGNVTIGQDLAVHGNIYFDPPQNTDQTIGNQNLTEVLNQGNIANQPIDLDGNNIIEVNRINGQLVQNLGTSNLTEVLDEGSKTGGTDIDFDDTNLTDTGKGNVTIGQDLKVYGNLWLPGAGKNGEIGSQNLSQVLREGNNASTSIDMTSNKITDLSDPTNPQDAATKSYVDTTDNTIQDDQTLQDALSLNNKVGGENINFDETSNIQASGTNAITLDNQQNIGIPNGNLDIAGNNIIEVNRINGQLVQNLGTSSLSEVLTEGSKTGGTDIDLDGANLTDTAKGNVTIGQDLLTYGAIYGTGADLAEKYPSNQDLEPGEIVRVSAEGHGKVVRTEERFSSSIGVVSSNPGLVMDRGQEGHVVGLTGKVPVKVRKTDIDAGDRIVPSQKDGAGTTCRTKDETAAESFEEFKQISKHNRECRSATLGTALEDRSRGETTITALVK